jgi:formylglycine-generating enzyme required for sulfatase activity
MLSARRRYLVVFIGLMAAGSSACEPAITRPSPRALETRERLEQIAAQQPGAASMTAAADGLDELARLQWAVGQVDAAEASFRRSLAARADGRVARSLVGLLHWRGHYVEAAKIARTWHIEPGAEPVDAWLNQLLAMTSSSPSTPAGLSSLAGFPGLELTAVPGGTWNRGADDGPANEWPLRTMVVSPFEIGTYEITVGQYAEFLRRSGYASEDDDWEWLRDPARHAHPATGISWRDARAFTIWFSAATGGVYRLPTEAEWEWAARGATGRLHPWGSVRGNPQEYGNWGRLSWRELRERVPQTVPVGHVVQDRSPFGIADMGGNAAEWCLDAYDATYYEWAPSADPYGSPDDGEGRVLRGWSFRAPGSGRGAAVDRSGYGVRQAYSMFGFRVVRESRATSRPPRTMPAADGRRPATGAPARRDPGSRRR